MTRPARLSPEHRARLAVAVAPVPRKWWTEPAGVPGEADAWLRYRGWWVVKSEAMDPRGRPESEVWTDPATNAGCRSRWTALRRQFARDDELAKMRREFRGVASETTQVVLDAAWGDDAARVWFVGSARSLYASTLVVRVATPDARAAKCAAAADPKAGWQRLDEEGLWWGRSRWARPVHSRDGFALAWAPWLRVAAAPVVGKSGLLAAAAAVLMLGGEFAVGDEFALRLPADDTAWLRVAMTDAGYDTPAGFVRKDWAFREEREWSWDGN